MGKKEVGIEWKNPPAPQPRRVDKVAADLRSRPGEWAKIAVESEGLTFFPWWQPIYASPSFETKVVRHNPDESPLIFGPRDIYARFIPEPEPEPPPEPLVLDVPEYDYYERDPEWTGFWARVKERLGWRT